MLDNMLDMLDACVLVYSCIYLYTHLYTSMHVYMLAEYAWVCILVHIPVYSTDLHVTC